MATPQRPGFDLRTLSTASKILLVASLLYLIDLFLPWQRQEGAFRDFTVSGWEGLGILNGILAIAILAWEIVRLANVQVNLPPRTAGMIEAALAGALLLFTVIKIIVDNEFLYIFAWIGLVLALVIAYGGYMRWQEAQAAGTARPTGGGFAA